jgi:hypothetical protein
MFKRLDPRLADHTYSLISMEVLSGVLEIRSPQIMQATKMTRSGTHPSISYLPGLPCDMTALAQNTRHRSIAWGLLVSLE